MDVQNLFKRSVTGQIGSWKLEHPNDPWLHVDLHKNETSFMLCSNECARVVYLQSQRIRNGVRREKAGID